MHRRNKVWTLIVLLFVVGAIVGFWVGRGKVRTPEIVVDSDKVRTVRLYYYNPARDEDASGNVICSAKGLVAVERVIPLTQTPIQDAVRLLIQGKVTSAERSQGITTEYPLEGFKLLAASVRDRVLTLTFEDPNLNSSGGACRVTVLREQIAATAQQFGGIDKVRFMPEDILFQP